MKRIKDDAKELNVLVENYKKALQKADKGAADLRSNIIELKSELEEEKANAKAIVEELEEAITELDKELHFSKCKIETLSVENEALLKLCQEYEKSSKRQSNYEKIDKAPHSITLNQTTYENLIANNQKLEGRIVELQITSEEYETILEAQQLRIQQLENILEVERRKSFASRDTSPFKKIQPELSVISSEASPRGCSRMKQIPNSLVGSEEMSLETSLEEPEDSSSFMVSPKPSVTPTRTGKGKSRRKEDLSSVNNPSKDQVLNSNEEIRAHLAVSDSADRRAQCYDGPDQIPEVSVSTSLARWQLWGNKPAGPDTAGNSASRKGNSEVRRRRRPSANAGIEEREDSLSSLHRSDVEMDSEGPGGGHRGIAAKAKKKSAASTTSVGEKARSLLLALSVGSGRQTHAVQPINFSPSKYIAYGGRGGDDEWVATEICDSPSHGGGIESDERCYRDGYGGGLSSDGSKVKRNDARDILNFSLDI